MDAILSRCTLMYVRRKLLEEGPGLTLARTLQLASQCESVEEQMSAMSGAAKAETETVHRVAQKGGRNWKTKRETSNQRECRGQREKHHHGSDEYVRFVAVSATPKALTTREVEEASATDPELIEVRKAITNGRFENCKAYAAVANELCVVGYLVLRGTRIVLPRSLHARALTLAHEGHLGIVGTKQHLRTKVWWPGMDRAAEKHCKECHGCQIVSRPDPPELLRPTPLPDGPWRDLAVDLLGPLPSNHSILVVVDYYSRYYEYDILTSTTTEKVIDSLESIFSRHGLPVTLKSDNGPQFKSELFREYCENNGITHLRATAKWAQANGEVERQNAALMKRIRIAHSERGWTGKGAEKVCDCVQEHRPRHDRKEPGRTSL
ncbi:hypothetical protein AAFF_G00194330 [Aldrovandia affinis]|uniref:Gypsy retrotransposon integrase-like protein 1 n=1 Tax=Aldrovandia affinis TaxID=143900 RepID=A0AAD7SXD3_9TELE|nr:hypothetical protein AAFF_G00194330 [Aldrovandia affinis]